MENLIGEETGKRTIFIDKILIRMKIKLHCLLFIFCSGHLYAQNKITKVRAYREVFQESSQTKHMLVTKLHFNADTLEICNIFNDDSDFSFYYPNLFDTTLIRAKNGLLTNIGENDLYIRDYLSVDSIVYIVSTTEKRYALLPCRPFFCNGFHCNEITVLAVEYDKYGIAKYIIEVETNFSDIDNLFKLITKSFLKSGKISVPSKTKLIWIECN